MRQRLESIKRLKVDVEYLEEKIEALTCAVQSVTRRMDRSIKSKGGINFTREELIDAKAMLEKKKAVLLREQTKAEKYIYTIPDSLTRIILVKRYIDGLSWKRIAYDVGAGNTADGVKQIAYRFLKKQKSGI